MAGRSEPIDKAQAKTGLPYQSYFTSDLYLPLPLDKLCDPESARS